MNARTALNTSPETAGSNATDDPALAVFATWCDAHRARTEAMLDAALPPAGMAPARLHEAMRYATLGGGKRIRALLVYAAGDLGGGRLDAGGELDAAACAVEMIHAYSLVHDDLPCMDDDDLRRGKPTVHKAFDEATAMLVGDALQTQAFGMIAQFRAATARLALSELARASGSIGMAGGQAIDLAAVGQAMKRTELEDMHRRKTGALLTASLRLGWLASRDDALVPAALDDYAAAIGLAFQVIDDVLDVEGDTVALGKTAGKDAANDKPTFVSLLGLADARRLAGELHAQARASLVVLGPGTASLAGLADLITSRGH